MRSESGTYEVTGTSEGEVFSRVDEKMDALFNLVEGEAKRFNIADNLKDSARHGLAEDITNRNTPAVRSAEHLLDSLILEDPDGSNAIGYNLRREVNERDIKQALVSFATGNKAN
jgi:hypothetical protein